MPRSHIVRKCTGATNLLICKKKINYQTYIYLFGKKEKQLDTQIQTIRIYSQDIGIKFAAEKCNMLLTRSEKRKNNGKNRTTKSRKNFFDKKETYEYLGIFEGNTIKQA